MRGRRVALVALGVLGAVAVVLLLALGRDDREPTGGGSAGEVSAAGAASGPSRLLEPPEFAAEVARSGVVTINVHVPDEGSIPGTDLAIPYDRIEASRAELPSKATPLAVYCRSGSMSAIAARALADDGYRRIYELAGGMEAWTESGRRLLPPA